MRTLQSIVAVLCVNLMLAPAAAAQQWSWQDRQHSWLTDPYRTKNIDPINLANSDRLEKLLRAGKLYLSLQDAIALALENNLDVELQRYGSQIADADLLRAKAGGLLRGVPQTVQTGPESVQAQVVGGATGGAGGGAGAARAEVGGAVTEAGGAIITATGTALPNLDPRMFFRYGWGHRSRPQSNTITTGTNSLYFRSHSWNYGYQQEWLTGSSLSFGWNNDRFRSNNPRSDLNPSTQANWQLQFTQRLLQGFGKAVNNRNIRIAKNNIRVSNLVFEQQVIATASSIIRLYWDLVAYAEDVKVKKQALALAEKLYNDNKRQVEIGTLAPIEIVSAEAQVARRQQELTASETSLLQQETVIKNALSKTGVASPSLAEARIVPTDRLRIPDVEPARPLDRLVRTALESRLEIEQTRINIDNTKIGMAGSKSQLRPSLDALVFYNHNGLAGQVNDLARPPFLPIVDEYFIGGYGTVMGQLLRRNFPDYGFGVQLNIPIRKRSAQADYVRDALTLRQQELREQRLINQVRVDVENTLIALTQARALYEAALKERILQEQTLEAEQKKYALGASTVFFVIQYQRDLAQAQSIEVASLAAYAKARVGLEQATGQTLAVNNIIIDEARQGRISRAPDPLPPVQTQ